MLIVLAIGCICIAIAVHRGVIMHKEELLYRKIRRRQENATLIIFDEEMNKL